MDLGAPLSDAQADALVSEIVDAHCGVVGLEAASVMADAQRVRDLHMARRLARVGNVRGAVLIAGHGHVRSDRGVPVQLRGLRPSATIASVGLLEVSADSPSPHDYPAEFGVTPLPFDYVLFTPRADDVDPCVKFADSLKTLSEKPVEDQRR